MRWRRIPRCSLNVRRSKRQELLFLGGQKQNLYVGPGNVGVVPNEYWSRVVYKRF